MEGKWRLPGLPFENYVDDNGLWDERYGPYSKEEAIEYGRACFMAGVDRAWEAVNAMIKPGPVGGNGLDKQAERNGLVLASNAIAGLKRG